MIKNWTFVMNQAGSQWHARVTLAILLIAVSLMAACNVGSKPVTSGNQPIGTSSICLEGIWGIRHPETYFRYSLPPGAFDLNTLTFKDSIGGIAYRFDNKGVLTIEAVGFDGKFDVKQGAEIAPLEMKMSGFASGAYTIDGDTVSLTKVISSEIQLLATYAGESMMDTNKVADFAPLFVPSYTSAKFECTPETLTLQIANFPSIKEKIEFQRLTK
jgi:hypothetical protein